MSFINHAAREMNCKLVYYGPGLGGKTTNLQYIYHHTSPENKGKIVALSGETERTLFFDFLPLHVGVINGFKTRFHLYTVPGQKFYEASRRLVLRGVDGVVFVADSQLSRLEDNIASLQDLTSQLRSQGYDPSAVPLVFQYNKRDAAPAAPVELLHKTLNASGAPEGEAIATQGAGVFDTLRQATQLVLRALRSTQALGA